MRSQLSLQVYESGDCNVLSLKDTSYYNPDITTSCGRLIITPPGFIDSFGFDVDEDFFECYNSNDFNYTNPECDDDLIALQDGIYQIRYEICPVDQLNVEYYHLRQTQAYNKYYKLLCGVRLETCEPSSKQQAKLDELKKAKLYLEAAKAYVEKCHVPDKGLELHNYALEILNDFEERCSDCG